MKISVENLGPIKAGEVDSGAGLTVFVGPNNSGKTYMSYLLYGVLRTKYFYNNQYITNLLNELVENGSTKIELSNFYKLVYRDVLEHFSGGLKKGLSDLFGLKEELYQIQFIEL